MYWQGPLGNNIQPSVCRWGNWSPARGNHYPSPQRSWTLEPEVGSCIHSVLQSSLSFISWAGYQYVGWLFLSTPQAVLADRKPPRPAPLLPVRFQPLRLPGDPGFPTHFFLGSAFSDLTSASRDGAHATRLSPNCSLFHLQAWVNTM